MYIERLSEAEELIMSIIWSSKEDLIVYDITDMIKDRFGRKWKPQTVLTFMDRLKNKGFIDSYKDKKKYKRIYTFFNATISKEEYLSVRFKEMQNIWFDGNKEDMKAFVEGIKE